MPEWIVKYWIEWLFGLVIALLTAGYKRISKQAKADRVKQAALQNGMCALLRNELIQSYNHYHDKGFCPIYARDNINALYNAYHALGGNGTVTQLKDSLMAMPTDEKGD